MMVCLRYVEREMMPPVYCYGLMLDLFVLMMRVYASI